MNKNKKINNDTPTLDINNYNTSLSKALNYYNETMSLSDYKNSVIDYALTIGIDLPRSIPEFEFRGIGAVCKLLMDEQPVSINHINLILTRINELTTYTKKHNVEYVVPVETVVKQVVDNTAPFITWLEDSIDEVILGKKKLLTDIALKYSSYTLTKTESKKIVNYITKILKQYNDDYKDFNNEDIKQSYSDIAKTNFKKLIESLSTFLETINKIDTAKKAPKKDKPAMVQVKTMPYLKTYNNDLQGLHPKDVIGKSFVLVFDTNTRDLIILQAIAGKFKAAGMSFTNIDEAKCIKKKLRNPDKQLNELLTMIDLNKKSIIEYFDTIKTTEQKSAARMSQDKIILKAF